MTGPEHYTEAERLIAVGESVAAEIRATESEPRRDALGKQAMGIWAQAQVHATLALAAATAAGAKYPSGQSAFTPGQYGRPQPAPTPPDAWDM